MSRDILLWVGKGFYPTEEDFLKEARERGACRRVARLPKDIKFGETRCFLVTGDKEEANVFAYFVIDHAECVGPVPPELQGEVVHVSMEEVAQESPRGCGMRKPGLYLVSYLPKNAMEKAMEGREGSVFGQIVVLDKPIPYIWEFFRGTQLIDGDRTLAEGRLRYTT